MTTLRNRVFLFFLLFSNANALGKALLLETCSVTEGKDEYFGSRDQSRAFQDFLVPGPWARTPADSFSGDFQWDLNRSGNRQIKAKWSQVGKLGSYQVRQVRYVAGGSVIAALLLIQDGANKFVPLMKWSGQMPAPAIYRVKTTNILVISRDFGGNIPMVRTWAWISLARGPVRLNVSAAVHDAIAKVAPGYSGYETGLDWNTLRCLTRVWKGPWPGKVEVADGLEAWFTIGRDGLMVKYVELREGTGDNLRTVRWPK